jgi:hypothetical protein
MLGRGGSQHQPARNLIDPGPVATNLRRVAFPGEDFDHTHKPEDVAPGIADAFSEAETGHGAFIRVSSVPLNA